ncbi:unnamed protein product, partial [Linum tenue]
PFSLGYWVCFSFSVHQISEIMSGSVTEIGGLRAYATGSSDSSLSLLLASDVLGTHKPIFPTSFVLLFSWNGYFIDFSSLIAHHFFVAGYETPNLRKLADKVAAAGFYVVVPDFFHGDPYVPGSEMPVSEKGVEDAKQVIAALRSSRGMSAVGAAGKVVVELAKSDVIQAAVLLHPSQVTVDDIKDVKKPIAVLGAEIDKFSPPELLRQFEQVLSTKPEVEGYVKIFGGVAHGWTTKYKDEDEASVRNAEEARQNMLDWFIKFVN